LDGARQHADLESRPVPRRAERPVAGDRRHAPVRGDAHHPASRRVANDAVDGSVGRDEELDSVHVRERGDGSRGAVDATDPVTVVHVEVAGRVAVDPVRALDARERLDASGRDVDLDDADARGDRRDPDRPPRGVDDEIRGRGDLDDD
jgi:hypothetical protein